MGHLPFAIAMANYQRLYFLYPWWYIIYYIYTLYIHIHTLWLSCSTALVDDDSRQILTFKISINPNSDNFNVKSDSNSFFDDAALWRANNGLALRHRWSSCYYYCISIIVIVTLLLVLVLLVHIINRAQSTFMTRITMIIIIAVYFCHYNYYHYLLSWISWNYHFTIIVIIIVLIVISTVLLSKSSWVRSIFMGRWWCWAAPRCQPQQWSQQPHCHLDGMGFPSCRFHHVWSQIP